MPKSLVLQGRCTPFAQHFVAKDDCILGRSSQCDIVLEDPSVSRQHARVHRAETGFTLEDLGSRNGTFVDERRIIVREICNGGVIRLGAISFAAYINDLPVLEEQTATCDSFDGKVPTATHRPVEILSPGQERVFEYLLNGLSEKTVARRLCLSRHTVHNHVRAIFRLHGVHSRAELLAKFIMKASSGAAGIG